MHSKAFTTVVRTSCRVYGFLLPLYPSYLRTEFGPQMADVFEQQIQEQCMQDGLYGAARVWFDVFSELIQTPAQRVFRWKTIMVSIASVLTTLALFETLLRATHLSAHCIK
jgi:hypothetical protein